MYFIVMWGTTIILSYGMKLVNGMRLFKDCADLGYKINLRKLNRISLSNSQDIESKLAVFIPIYNMMIELKKTFVYNSASKEAIEVLERNNALIPMEQEESERYQRSKTTINAWFISMYSDSNFTDEDSEKIKLVIHHKDKGDSIIYYTIDNDLNYRIIKSFGSYSSLSNDELIEIVAKAFDITAIKCGSWMNFIREMSKDNKNYVVEINEEDLENYQKQNNLSLADELEKLIDADESKPLSVKEELKNALQEWREELLEVESVYQKSKNKKLGQRKIFRNKSQKD